MVGGGGGSQMDKKKGRNEQERKSVWGHVVVIMDLEQGDNDILRNCESH